MSNPSVRIVGSAIGNIAKTLNERSLATNDREQAKAAAILFTVSGTFANTPQSLDRLFHLICDFAEREAKILKQEDN